MTRHGFGERLRIVMEERRLSQTALASALFVSRQAVGRWLAGVVPHRRTLNTIVLRLGISTEWLLSGKGDKNVPDYDPSVASSGDFARLLGELSNASQVLDPLVTEYETILRNSEQRASM